MCDVHGLIYNGMTFEQLTQGNGPAKICLPEGMTGNRVKSVFEGFMRDYPKLQAEKDLTNPD